MTEHYTPDFTRTGDVFVSRDGTEWTLDSLDRSCGNTQPVYLLNTISRHSFCIDGEYVRQGIIHDWDIVSQYTPAAPSQPAPRYACSKLAAVGDTVKVIGSNPPLHMKVEEVSPTGGLYIKSPTGAWCMLLNSSQVEFVPEVTPAHPVCRGCNQPLKAENAWMSDGCPCNNPRGINHGLVPKGVCTCDECSPQPTAAERDVPPENDVESRTSDLREIVKNVLEDATRTICYEVRRAARNAQKDAATPPAKPETAIEALMQSCQPIVETTPVVAKYRSKPCVIEAIHYDGTKSSFDAIYEWMDGDSPKSANLGYRGPSEHDPQQFGIKTLEGQMIATPGDWIIKGTHGEFYACKPEVFAVKYELDGNELPTVTEAFRAAADIEAGIPAKEFDEVTEYMRENGMLQGNELPQPIPGEAKVEVKK